jgi:hypothetical protein
MEPRDSINANLSRSQIRVLKVTERQFGQPFLWDLLNPTDDINLTNDIEQELA